MVSQATRGSEVLMCSFVAVQVADLALYWGCRSADGEYISPCSF